MKIRQTKQEDGTTLTIVASIPTEDVIVKSKVDYVPQYVTDVYGKTHRLTKDVTFARLLKDVRTHFPKHELVTIGTPVNFDLAPTHLSRVEMQFKNEKQVKECLKEISLSDMLIRSRVQPAWDWQMPMLHDKHVVLHVGWYDTVYFMQFKDIFLGQMHCRYSAKFGFDPKDAKISHFRYTDLGELELIDELNEHEKYADSIKKQVEFTRIFRDGSSELT
jgi:hypothetical protein